MPTSGTKSRFQPQGVSTRPIYIRLCEEDCEYLAIKASENNMTMTDFIRYLLRKDRDGRVVEIADVMREQDAEQLFNDPSFYEGLGTKTYTMEEIQKLRKENNEES